MNLVVIHLETTFYEAFIRINLIFQDFSYFLKFKEKAAIRICLTSHTPFIGQGVVSFFLSNNSKYSCRNANNYRAGGGGLSVPVVLIFQTLESPALVRLRDDSGWLNKNKYLIKKKKCF